ncbi:MAG: hypothetical protein J1F67_10935 [Muribaculaceae bacterium]|nr:hypothetical protein [Muribaculaceae bacterium]
MRQLKLDRNKINFNNPKYNKEETQIKLKELQEKISKLSCKDEAIWINIFEYIETHPRFIYLECDKCEACGNVRTKLYVEKKYNDNRVHGDFVYLIFCPDCGNYEFKERRYYYSI